jgi:hypothetical protein
MTEVDEASEDESLEDLLVVGREILDSWKARGVHKMHRSSNVAPNEAHLPMTYGLAAHAHLVAESAFDLLEQGKIAQSYPLARLAYECAMKAQWMALSTDGPEALANELSRHQKAVSRELAGARSSILRDGSGTLPYENVEKLESTADLAAHYFRQLCLDLEPADIDAYIYYRMLSIYSHASLEVTDMYVKAAPEGFESAAVLRVDPKHPDAVTPAGFTARSLVWAGSAFDYLIAGHPRRRKLEEFAEALQIPAMLHLRPEVLQRKFVAQKAAKEATRAERRRGNSSV